MSGVDLKVEKGLLEKIVKCFHDYLGDNLTSIVLFGSQARGDANESSDYDLLLVAEKLPVRLIERNVYVRTPIIDKFDEKLSIIAKTRSEFLSYFSSLYLDIGLDGIILYDKNFMKEKLEKIRKIITRTGLHRRSDDGFYWEWEKYPKPGHWGIDWSGYYEF